MQLRKFRFPDYDAAKTELFPLLHGRVFHATTATAYASILSDGYVSSNTDSRYQYAYPQSGNSYFRKNGYVSVIDLRTATDEQIEDGDMRYRFLSPSSSSRPTVLLFLKPHCYDKLVGWEASKLEGLKTMIVPYVESGFPEAIHVDCIEEAWEVDIEPPSLNSFDALIASLDEADEPPK